MMYSSIKSPPPKKVLNQDSNAIDSPLRLGRKSPASSIAAKSLKSGRASPTLNSVKSNNNDKYSENAPVTLAAKKKGKTSPR